MRAVEQHQRQLRQALDQLKQYQNDAAVSAVAAIDSSTAAVTSKDEDILPPAEAALHSLSYDAEEWHRALVKSSEKFSHRVGRSIGELRSRGYGALRLAKQRRNERCSLLLAMLSQYASIRVSVFDRFSTMTLWSLRSVCWLIREWSIAALHAQGDVVLVGGGLGDSRRSLARARSLQLHSMKWDWDEQPGDELATTDEDEDEESVRSCSSGEDSYSGSDDDGPEDRESSESQRRINVPALSKPRVRAAYCRREPRIGTNYARYVVCGGERLIDTPEESWAPGPHFSVSAAVSEWRHNSTVWHSLPPMSVPRSCANAVGLSDGRVMVLGGLAGKIVSTEPQEVTAPQEYDEHMPSNNISISNTVEVLSANDEGWSTATTMSIPRANAMAGLLPNGHVIVA